MAKKYYPKAVTDVGTAAYAWLNKPDTGGEYSDGKFKTDLILDADAPCIEKITELCKAIAKEEFGAIPKSLALPFKDGDEIAEEKDKPELKGKVVIRCKSKFKPDVVGADKQPLPEGEFVMSGDQIRLSVTVLPYKMGAKKGVTLQLRAVQLIEKRARSSAADDFDEFESDGAPAKGEASGEDDDVDF